MLRVFLLISVKTQQYSLIGHFFWFSFWCHPAALQQFYLLRKQPPTVNAASEVLWAFKLALVFADLGPYEPNRSVNRPGTKLPVVKLVCLLWGHVVRCWSGPVHWELPVWAGSTNRSLCGKRCKVRSLLLTAVNANQCFYRKHVNVPKQTALQKQFGENSCVEPVLSVWSLASSGVQSQVLLEIKPCETLRVLLSLWDHTVILEVGVLGLHPKGERENHSVLPPSVPDVIPASRGEITANLLFISNIPQSLWESRLSGGGRGGFPGSLWICFLWRSLRKFLGCFREGLEGYLGLLRSFQVSLSSRLPSEGLRDMWACESEVFLTRRSGLAWPTPPTDPDRNHLLSGSVYLQGLSVAPCWDTFLMHSSPVFTSRLILSMICGRRHSGQDDGNNSRLKRLSWSGYIHFSCI